MMETSLTELYTTIALFKRQPHKIAKHTQKIHWLLPTNCLSVLNHFVELALKGLKNRLKNQKMDSLHLVVTSCLQKTRSNIDLTETKLLWMKKQIKNKVLTIFTIKNLI